MSEKRMVSGAVLVSALVFGLVNCSYAEEKGLIGCWKFDEGEGSTIKDSSGNKNNGNIRGAEAEWVKGIKGGAIKLDNDYVYLNDKVNLGVSDFSVTAWIKTPDKSSLSVIMSLVSGGGQKGLFYTIEKNSGRVSFSLHGDKRCYVSGETDVTDDIWHYVAAVRKGAQYFVYVDGMADGTSSSAAVIDFGTGQIPPHIGAMRAKQHHFKGIIDEVRIYKRALSVKEIKNQYELLSGRNIRKNIYENKAPGISQKHQYDVNLFINGDMEIDANGDGIPDGWSKPGGVRINDILFGHNVKGHAGGKALKITGPNIPAVRGGCAARTTCSFELKKGSAYRFSFWLKSEGPPTPCAVSLSPGAARIYEPVLATSEWQQFSWTFLATKDVSRGKRPSYSVMRGAGYFQIAMSSPGPVLLDDVALQEIPLEALSKFQRETASLTHGQRGGAFWPGDIWPQKADGNLIPNASFELGNGGWGSWVPKQEGAEVGLNLPYRLISKVDSNVAKYGRNSLRIDLDRDNLLPNLWAARGGGGYPFTKLFAGTYGLLSLKPGTRYVLSAWLKSDTIDTVATLSVIKPKFAGTGLAPSPMKRFAIGSEWKRVSLVFTVDTVDIRNGKRQSDIAYVIPVVGLDWQLTGRKKATLWVDAVQLEEASSAEQHPSEFKTREGVQVGLETAKTGNVFYKGESLKVSACAFNDTATAKNISGELKVTDYWDRQVFSLPIKFSLAPGQSKSKLINTKLTRAGFYRVRFTESGKDPCPFLQNLRCAIIKPYDRKRHPGVPRFGTMYSIGSSERKLLSAAGLGVVLYCDVHPDQIEPVEGCGEYGNQDKDVNRFIRDGIDVHAVIHTPWCGWNSVVPYDCSVLYDPAHWSVYWHSKPYFHWEHPQYDCPLSLVKRPGGGWAARFSPPRKGFDRKEGPPRLEQRNLRLKKGGEYRVSFFAQSSSGSKGCVTFMTYPERAAAGLNETFSLLRDVATIPRWKKYEFDFTCTAGTLLGSSLQFYTTGAGILNVDDVSVREIHSKGKLGPELVINGNFQEYFINGGMKRFSARRSGTDKNYCLPPDFDRVREFWKRTVTHFKGRIKNWEVLAEVTYLTTEEYARYLKAAHDGIKAADPDATVVGGTCPVNMYGLGFLRELVEFGALKNLDVLTFHSYDGTMPPATLESPLERANAFMDAHGGRKLIRITEGWRFADDDSLISVEAVNPTYVLGSEKEYGDYLVRFGTILFGNGVDCIQFFFTGHKGMLRPGHAAIYEYGCVPRKIYAVMPAFCHIVPPEAKIEKKVKLFNYSLYAYVFSRKNDAVAVVWSPNKAYEINKAAIGTVKPLDIFGEPIIGNTVSINQSPIYLKGKSVKAVLKAVNALQNARERQGKAAL